MTNIQKMVRKFKQERQSQTLKSDGIKIIKIAPKSKKAATYLTFKILRHPSGSRQIQNCKCILHCLIDQLVHVIHTYDRIVPYVGHKRLTVVTSPPKVYSTRRSVLQKEYDWIENKLRPWVAYSPTNRYLDSDSSVRYVYVRNPISGLKYHEYLPSRYYNYFRIIRPLSTYVDYYWPYYRPLSSYSDFWPLYRSLSYIDDLPIYRSLRLQRNYDSLTGYYYPYSLRRYNYYNYYRYYKPLYSYWPTTYYSSWYPRYYYWPTYTRYSSWYPRYSYWPLTYYYNDYWPIWRYYSYTYPKISHYWLKYLPICYTMNSLRSRYAKNLQDIFDDETRLIRAQTASLLKQVHLPVPRIRSWSVEPLNRYGSLSSLPVKYSNDTYIHRLLTVSPTSKVEYATYYTEPVKKYIGQGHLSCVSYAGDKSYNRRRPLAIFEDALKNDIQLLSYYITKFRQEKAQPKEIQVPLSPVRPSRIFSVHKPLEDPVVQEIKDLREARAARLAKIYDDTTPAKSTSDVEESLKAKKKKEEARLAEERALAEEQARKQAQAKKDEAARKAELARQEQLAAQAAAERAAELERQAELARQEELAKQAEIEKARQLEEEKARLEEQRRLEEEAKAEEERQQLLRLEEIARQAEEEKEAELARQAEELAELARQEAERAEIERQEREEQEKAQKEAELAELARQEAELAELERQEKELAELAKQEAELAEKAKEEAELATKEAQLALDETEAAPEVETVPEDSVDQVVEEDKVEDEAEPEETPAEESQPVAESEAEAPAESEPVEEPTPDEPQEPTPNDDEVQESEE